MRAAIVGGIIAIISLAYGIVQAGWWPRSGPVPQATQVQALEMQKPQVEVPQVVASVPEAPLDEAMPAPMPPAEAASNSTLAPTEAPVAPAVVLTETSANPVIATAEAPIRSLLPQRSLLQQ